MLIELEDGNYINTEFIEYIGKTEPYESYDWEIFFNGEDTANSTQISDADKERIIKVMGLVEDDEGEETQITGFGGKCDE